MFDFGWQEFLVIAFVLVLVVGPKDLPKVLKTVTKYIRNMRQMASEFHRGIEKMADEADLKDSFNELKNNNIDIVIDNITIINTCNLYEFSNSSIIFLK